jgi:FO synthase
MWIVLPVKDLRHSKARLKTLLSPEQRAQLMRTMVEDALDQLTRATKVSGVLLVSKDARIASLAEKYGVETLAAGGDTGLNQAVGEACEHLARRGHRACMIVHGDVPLLQAGEIDRLIALASPHNSLLVPCKNGEGTNVMVTPLPLRFALHYGEASFSKHLKAAKTAGLDPHIEKQTPLALDINEPACLSKLGDYLARANSRNASRALRILNDLALLAGPSNWTIISSNAAPLGDEQALALSAETDTVGLMKAAAQMRDDWHGNVVSYSPKVFIPLTRLCRDVCHYCTFATRPSRLKAPYLSLDEVLPIARHGAAQDCKEALFTLGERPELRYREAREALAAMGFTSTLDYVAHCAEAVLEETGLLPHINAGCMTRDEIAMLRPVSASMGLMLESSSERLCQKGMAHHGSPDKAPQMRLETIASAGDMGVPFTSGILIGIGETRYERVQSLLALRRLHQRHGHLQEIIIQNFRAKPGTKMAAAPEPDLADLQWTIAVARLIFGPRMSIQAPPNLAPGSAAALIQAGINDWGGVSPVTLDFVNPEAPWPAREELVRQTTSAGKHLQQRLTVYPSYVRHHRQWIAPGLHRAVLQLADAQGFARQDRWCPGTAKKFPEETSRTITASARELATPSRRLILARLENGESVGEAEIVHLFEARGADFSALCRAADRLRLRVCGNQVTYVVNRNINYTNICMLKCQFCAFSKGKRAENLRGRPYKLNLEEIAERASEAWARGATEVCLQGGIHPDYTGRTYIEICEAVKAAAPSLHIHAFSPLEVWHGATTCGLTLENFLLELKRAGLGTLPGTAAEILCDEVRATLCPDKITSQQWLDVMATAHELELKTTATIMFGHIDGYRHWARHLVAVRELQMQTGGFTEFVPLPFVAQEAPIYLKGRARRGPTAREVVLMHAVARLVLHPVLTNIQASWVKLGIEGLRACLQAGANDAGGTLMNESITRAAGGAHGQELPPIEMERLILDCGRQPSQRTTLYRAPVLNSGRETENSLALGAAAT